MTKKGSKSQVKTRKPSTKRHSIKKGKRKKPTLAETKTKKLKKLFIKNFADLGANVSATCLATKIGRRTFYNWYEQDKIFAEDIEYCELECIDNVESKLYSNAIEGNPVSIFYYLNNKKYGYNNLSGRKGGSSKSDKELSNIAEQAMDALTKLTRNSPSILRSSANK